MVVKLLIACITYTHSYQINLIVWRRLAVCSQNVAVHIQSDLIVRQWLHFSFESVIYHDDQLKLIWWCKAWLVLWKKKMPFVEGVGHALTCCYRTWMNSYWKHVEKSDEVSLMVLIFFSVRPFSRSHSQGRFFFF